jgi:glycerate 2-kinase
MPRTLDPTHDPRGFLRALYDAAVQRAQPAVVLAGQLPAPPRGRTLVIGAGKAGGAMAAAVDALWPADAPLSGLVVTRYDHVPPAYKAQPGRIEVVEAAHPVPDEAGRRAAQRIVELTHGLTADDLVLCLISGGGSALLAAPAEGLSFEDKQAVNRALLASGAPIDAMNCVRKHLSALKGGRLGALCAPARVLTLLISDVPGDDPAVIASGPTVPDPTTCADALAILDRHGIALPPAARAGLESGAFETPKPGDDRFAGHELRMIATPRQSLEAAAALARSAGVAAHILSDEIEGESRDIGRMHAALARSVERHGTPFPKPCVILSGGETTVTVRPPPGRSRAAAGGPASSCSAARWRCRLSPTSGPWRRTPTASTAWRTTPAPSSPRTPWLAPLRSGVNFAEHLARHDAYTAFASIGDLVVTGPTYTNVNDFRALLLV